MAANLKIASTQDLLIQFEAVLDEELEVLRTGTPEALLELTAQKKSLVIQLSHQAPSAELRQHAHRCQEKNQRNGALLNLLAIRSRRDLSLLGDSADTSYSRSGATPVSLSSRFKLSA